MPFASFIKVREVSSEDKIDLAENLIKSQANKKWKTKNVGEKSAYVILEMLENYQIVGIDIGNEHSAFVEVLVGKSTCAPEDFKEILLTCSFMTPLESKSSININRVRCFSKETLVPIVVDSKWSLLKIVCSQPFNKYVQYGLSFIKLHVLENKKPKEKETSISPVSDQLLSNKVWNKKRSRDKITLPKLKFREDSPESEIDDTVHLFSRWKKIKEESITSLITTNRNKETVLNRRFDGARSMNNSHADATSNIRDRNRDDLAFGGEDLDKSGDQDKLERLSKNIKDGKEKGLLKKEKIAKSNANSLNNKMLELSSSFKADDEIDNTCKKLKGVKDQDCVYSKSNFKKIKNTSKFAPFNKLLNGVVLAISGIQNPERSDLRNKAIAMGAKYKGDWDSTCTHLICAFKNTPKYKQVSGEGKIVTPSWINKCYDLKKYLPWRRYALDSNELNKQESDEEIDMDQCEEQLLASESNRQNDTLGIYDVDDLQRSSSIEVGEIHSDCDTDDEIKRVEESLRNKGDVYDASTDEDDYLKEKYKQT